jgi:hypothetical protein
VASSFPNARHVHAVGRAGPSGIILVRCGDY